MSAVGLDVISREIEDLIKADERRKDLPRDVVERWFRGCSFDEAKEKLVHLGFQVGEYDTIPSWQIRQGIKRVADGEKKLSELFESGSTDPVGAHLLRVTLFDFGDHYEARTLIYTDAP
jgi:hypothetical protein